VRITLFSVFFSGIVLVAFGLFFQRLTARMNLDRIDREIQTLGESQLVVLHPREHWQQLDQSLQAIYGEQNINKLMVQVVAGGGNIPYVSPNWPEEISLSSFPKFDSAMLPPPRPGPGGRFRRLPGMPVPPGNLKSPLFRTFHCAGKDWRVGIMGNTWFTILVGMDLTAYHEDAKKYAAMFMMAIPIALLLLAVGGWMVAHRALAPVRLIAKTTESITARGLDKRIPDTGSTSEFRELIHVINDMLDRLETSFSQAARFSADAAHELQTPLTILQGILDDAVQHTPVGSEEQRRSSNLLEEVQRLKVIVQKLLILSRADAGQLRLATEPVNFSRLTEEIIEDISIIAPHLSIEQKLSPDIRIAADPVLIRQVVQNLGSNAAKHNIQNGMVRFTLKADHGMAVLDVVNTGPPIAPGEQKRVFDRFYRVDKARSNKTPGAGLGLALAKEITRAHKGHLSVNTDPVRGLITFTLRLPCAT
jgi:two-component system, OmpR family, heavy metal sensor histidine kinase CusS